MAEQSCNLCLHLSYDRFLMFSALTFFCERTVLNPSRDQCQIETQNIKPMSALVFLSKIQSCKDLCGVPLLFISGCCSCQLKTTF